MNSIENIFDAGCWLRKNLREVDNLRKMSWLKSRLLLRGSPLKNEKIHIGPSQNWLGRLWESRLGSANGTIFKVGLEAQTTGREDSINLLENVATKLKEHLGEGNQAGEGVLLWDGDDGNVVVQYTNVGGDRRILVVLTSNIVRQLTHR